MGILSQISLGFTLTKLTNVYEELERSRQASFIGAGGGIDALPLARQKELERKMPGWLDTLRSHPRHVITRELLKNIRLAQQMGKAERINALARLLDRLVEMGIALGPDEFERSYAD